MLRLALYLELKLISTVLIIIGGSINCQPPLSFIVFFPPTYNSIFIIFVGIYPFGSHQRRAMVDKMHISLIMPRMKCRCPYSASAMIGHARFRGAPLPHTVGQA